MAVIIEQIVTEAVQARPAPAEPRDRPAPAQDTGPSMEALRFEFLRDAQRKARLQVD